MRKTLALTLGAALALVSGLTGCTSAPSSTPEDTAVSSPSVAAHAFTDDSGATVEVPGNLSRIVSTSVTLTGTLLALDAPVVGSGGSKPNAAGLDEHGWFMHWADLAEQRQVQSLYTSQQVDLEAIMAANPELIVVAKTGGDSAMDQYEQLRTIAPTIVIDYNNTDWRTVTERVAEALGTPDVAATVLADFDQKLADTKSRIAVPQVEVDLGVYSGDGGLAVGLPAAPQGKVLQELGFTIHDSGLTPENGRTDFAFASKEQSLQAMTQDTLLLVGNNDKDKAALLEDASFASLPSVKSGHVYALGDASFKLDYFAAIDLLEHVKVAFAK